MDANDCSTRLTRNSREGTSEVGFYELPHKQTITKDDERGGMPLGVVPLLMKPRNKLAKKRLMAESLKIMGDYLDLLYAHVYKILVYRARARMLHDREAYKNAENLRKEFQYYTSKDYVKALKKLLILDRKTRKRLDEYVDGYRKLLVEAEAWLMDIRRAEFLLSVLSDAGLCRPARSGKQGGLAEDPATSQRGDKENEVRQEPEGDKNNDHGVQASEATSQ